MKLVLKLVIALFVGSMYSKSYPQALLIKEVSKKNETVNVVDKIILEESKRLKIDVTIPQIVNKKNVEFMNKFNNNIVNDTDIWLNDIKKVTQEYFSNGEIPAFPFEAYAKYTVGKNTDDFISLYIDYYQFTGGAHGITIRKSHTLDLNYGKEIMLQDLFKEGYDYKTVINNYIKTEINKNKDNYFSGKDGFNGIGESQNYYIKDNKLIIYFQQYEIAPYVAGIVEFNIDMEIFENNFLYDKIISK